METKPKVTKSKQIEWGFGEVHKDYIRRCRDNTINVAEGAVRAGKTIDNIFAFAMELERTADKIHVATGSTVGNAKLNIGESNGFGLEYIFRGRSRWGKFKDNECMYIKTMTGEKIVIFVGGSKADSFKSFRGNSYGLWIATEINLHHDNTIKEAFNRQLMAKNRKIFWDLNPSKPTHSIYTDYIDKYQEQSDKGKFIGGYNYQHFTIFDNINLTERRIEEIVSQYDKNSVWYLRDIEGRRMVAEGLIYRLFADDPEKYLLKENKYRFKEINIGVDYGGNESFHTFVATGITHDYKEVVALVSERHKADVDPEELNQLFVDFIERVIALHGFVNYAYCDNAEQVLIRGFKKAVQENSLPIKVRDAKKIQILDRIRLVTSLMAQERFYYTDNSITLKEALEGAVWVDKSDAKDNDDERLDDGSSDIDTLDAFEYSIERDVRRFMRK